MRKMLIISILFLLVACGESSSKCEHLQVKTLYSEGDWFALDKTIVCADCNEEIENSSVQQVEYVYNRKLVNESGIALTLNKITIDGWGSIVMKFVVEGTASSGRTISIDNMYINDTDVNGMLYVSDIKDHKRANEDVFIYDGLEAKDLLVNQDYVMEIEYEIMNSNSYKKLKTGSVTFNLNEYTMIDEVKE